MRSDEPGAGPPGWVPLCVPHLAGREKEYLAECIETNFVSSVGPFVARFEQLVAEYVGTRFAVATVNGTAALHLALIAAGVRPEDEVMVSTLSFIAPANAVRYVRAWPLFVDAERDHWQLDVAKAADLIERDCSWERGSLRNRKTNRRVAAILPVHILGHPVDMDPLLELAGRFGLPVIEDATESLGATYRGRSVGALGKSSCLSFNGNKLITTGGGGMFLTDDEAMARQVRYLSTQAKDDAVEFVHGAVGYNYRLTNIQAAVGCAQMERIDQLLEAKARIAATYARAFADCPGLTIQPEATYARSAHWLSTILVDPRDFGRSSRELLSALETERIQTRPLWQPLHLSPAHAGASATDCSVAERLNSTALSLPSSAGLDEGTQRRVIAAVLARAKSRGSAQASGHGAPLAVPG